MIESLFLGYIHGLLSESQGDSKDKTFQSSERDLKVEDKEVFLESVKKALLLFSSEGSDKDDNIILKAFFDFLRVQVIDVFDKVSIKFFVASKEEKTMLLDRLFPRDELFFKSLKPFLIIASSEEFQEILTTIFQKAYPERSLVTIQSARECSSSLKEEIRQNFEKDSLVIFQVNRRLLGGMLVYKNGEIQDLSWLGRVNNLKNYNVS